jgi:hypothetical protein
MLREFCVASPGQISAEKITLKMQKVITYISFRKSNVWPGVIHTTTLSKALVVAGSKTTPY